MLLIQITAAHGPAECELAARLTLQRLLQEAEAAGIRFELLECMDSKAGIKSALLCSKDGQAENWIRPWIGTIQWVFTSPMRPQHKRKNWFVAVQSCAVPEVLCTDDEIHFQTCRASGAGGQHVNTTDSAVHATHIASGLSVKVASERSQHANKRLARELLAVKLAQHNQRQQDAARQDRSRQHWQVERGAAVKVFRR